MSPKQKRRFWNSVDWRLQNSVIGAKFRVSPLVVRYWRLKLRKPRARTHGEHLKQKAQTRAIWSKWDWTLRDIDLAERHGVTRERIRQIRNLLGMPRSPKHRQQRTLAELDILRQPHRFAAFGRPGR